MSYNHTTPHRLVEAIRFRKVGYPAVVLGGADGYGVETNQRVMQFTKARILLHSQDDVTVTFKIQKALRDKWSDYGDSAFTDLAGFTGLILRPGAKLWLDEIDPVSAGLFNLISLVPTAFDVDPDNSNVSGGKAYMTVFSQGEIVVAQKDNEAGRIDRYENTQDMVAGADWNVGNTVWPWIPQEGP